MNRKPEQKAKHATYMRKYYAALAPEKKQKWIARCAGYASKHPEYRYAYHLRTRYKMTPEDYFRMLEEQNHRCKLCFIHEDNVRAWKGRLMPFTVDHSHETGEVRGLLCDNCNNVLGKVKEDPDLLCRMIEYVQFYKPLLRIA